MFETPSCALWQDGVQITALKLNAEQWDLFIKALSDFADEDHNEEVE